jgi:hypothetical protein
MYFKWAIATQSVYKDCQSCRTAGVTKGSFYNLRLVKYFLASIWPATTLITRTSQLHSPGQEKPMFAGRHLQWPLTV